MFLFSVFFQLSACQRTPDTADQQYESSVSSKEFDQEEPDWDGRFSGSNLKESDYSDLGKEKANYYRNKYKGP